MAGPHNDKHTHRGFMCCKCLPQRQPIAQQIAQFIELLLAGFNAAAVSLPGAVVQSLAQAGYKVSEAGYETICTQLHGLT